jgi:hypothetical protein
VSRIQPPRAKAQKVPSSRSQNEDGDASRRGGPELLADAERVDVQQGDGSPGATSPQVLESLVFASSSGAVGLKPTQGIMVPSERGPVVC